MSNKHNNAYQKHLTILNREDVFRDGYRIH